MTVTDILARNLYRNANANGGYDPDDIIRVSDLQPILDQLVARERSTLDTLKNINNDLVAAIHKLRDEIVALREAQPVSVRKKLENPLFRLDVKNRRL